MTYNYTTASEYFAKLKTYEYTRYKIKKETTSKQLALFLISLDCQALGLEEPTEEDIIEVDAIQNNIFKDAVDKGR